MKINIYANIFHMLSFVVCLGFEFYLKILNFFIRPITMQLKTNIDDRPTYK